ncbi:MAG: peptidoglycan-binding domain-containing protein [Christensenellales bacterium]|jgi:peptidoglycan hydrolase-like protein with peptidoglycan-binding domain
MSQGSTRRSSRRLLIVSVALLALSLFFVYRTIQLEREYQLLSAQTPVSSQAPPPLAFRPLAPLYRHGSVGPEVIDLQARLQNLGYYHGELDGKYYEETQAAVKAFQQQHGLDADGVAGEMTLRVLNSEEAQPCRQTTSPDISSGTYIKPAP